MKPATYWYNQMGSSEEYTAMWQSHMEDLIKQIQLDALRQGMYIAAKITRECYTHGFKYSDTSEHNSGVHDVEFKILSKVESTQLPCDE
jgi:CMP-2-keto-3-deoxyoctulosonic acid synthetase